MEIQPDKPRAYPTALDSVAVMGKFFFNDKNAKEALGLPGTLPKFIDHSDAVARFPGYADAFARFVNFVRNERVVGSTASKMIGDNEPGESGKGVITVRGDRQPPRESTTTIHGDTVGVNAHARRSSGGKRYGADAASGKDDNPFVGRKFLLLKKVDDSARPEGARTLTREEVLALPAFSLKRVPDGTAASATPDSNSLLAEVMPDGTLVWPADMKELQISRS